MPPPANTPHYQQHVFFRSADGHVQHVLWDETAHAFSADVWTRRAQASPAVGEIASLVTDCRQHAFYRDAYGHVHQIFWDVPGGTLQHVVWTRAAQAPLAAGDPVPLATPGQLHVFYRGVDGAVEHIVSNAEADGIVGKDNWTSLAHAAPMAGNPAVLATPNQQHVFYRGDDDHIHHIVWSAGPGPPGADDWTAKANAPLATGDPVAMLVGNQQHVFYRSIGGSIAHIVWAPSSGAPVADDWTAKAVAPRAAGERVAPLLASGQQHVFYRAVGGGVVHILWNPATNAMGWDDWTLRSGAPLAAGDPTALATDGQQHVFYRSVAGSVIHVLWHAGLDHPRCDDWTFQSGSAAIAGNVGAFRSSEGPDPLALRILALGDSMTEGFVPQWKGGYRARLFQTAHRAGKHLAFVGSRFDGPLTIDGVCFPRAHEGHSGKNIDFIATLIPEVLSSKPKIILLMVGANDVLRRGDANYDAAALGDAPNRLGRLLDSLVAAEPDALVVVAKIPLMDPRNPLHPEEPVNPLVSAAAWDASIRTYNEGVESVVRQRMVAGACIALADMHTGFTPAMLGEDGTHPNEDGYQHIASVWYEAIRGYLN